MAGAWRVSGHYVPKDAKLAVGRAIAEKARRQHGVVSLRQLEELGLRGSAIRKRVARGSLHRVHRGVFAVGHPLLTVEGRLMAAVLACGPGAVLSHRTAAAHWGISADATARLDVSSPRRAGRGRPGITVHSGAALKPGDATVREGIPCTTVARTLVDLAGMIDRAALSRACERAEALRLFDGRAVTAQLARAGGRSGAAALRATLADWLAESEFTRNEFERRFLELCSEAGVPRPEVNVWLALPGEGVEVDFLWPAEGLAVETDSRTHHGTRRAFERDRRRDQRLLVAGFRVARFTWRQVFNRPDEVVATLRALLPSGGPRRQPAQSNRAPGAPSTAQEADRAARKAR
jgi:predicted transcriptional regulator of viral defense system